MPLDPKRMPLYVGVGTFVLLTVSALLFADKFAFLQNKPDSPDSTGKCPKKCCSACSLNLPLVLIFGAGLGVAAAAVTGLANKEHREKLKSLVGGGSAAA